MANCDTRSKRASSVGMSLPFILALPLPDGSIDQADRQHGAHSYSGILAAAPAVEPQIIEPRLRVRRVPAPPTRRNRSV